MIFTITRSGALSALHNRLTAKAVLLWLCARIGYKP